MANNFESANEPLVIWATWKGPLANYPIIHDQSTRSLHYLPGLCPNERCQGKCAFVTNRQLNTRSGALFFVAATRSVEVFTRMSRSLQLKRSEFGEHTQVLRFRLVKRSLG